MKLVIFGLSISSSWGNGHATIWRGLCGALARQRHDVTFFERDVPYYAAHRDLQNSDDYELVLYSEWNDAEPHVREALRSAEIAMVTSYCPDAVCASDMILNSAVPRRVFYDLDTPVTLERLEQEQAVEYIPPYGLEPFDLVLSYTGGRALEGLQSGLGARRVAPLYGSVDPDLHKPVDPSPQYSADLSYLGTYAPDRQQALEQLFLEPGREILIASQAGDVVDALALSPDELWRIGSAARERVLDEHTSDHRSRELIRLLEAAA